MTSPGKLMTRGMKRSLSELEAKPPTPTRAAKKIKQTPSPGPSLRLRSPSKKRKVEVSVEITVPPAAPPQDRTLHWLSHFAETFLPLLPEANYIAAKRIQNPQIIPYMPVQQPSDVSGLKEYQLAGLSFLLYLYRNKASGILGDEMGLGKTLQTLSLFAWLKEHEGISGPHLVICPLSVVQSWEAEVKKWTPSLKSLRFHGSQNERARLLSTIKSGSYDIVITSYEAYRAEHGRLKKLGHWQYLVLDEGHKIKNSRTEISSTLHGLNAAHRLLLTGTPLQNNLQELWSLLHWMYPAVFTDRTVQPFVDAFDFTAGQYDRTFMTSCQKLLQLIMLRRTKEGVASELTVPPREEFTLYAPLSPLQRFWYQRLLTQLDSGTFSEVFGVQSNDEDEQIIQETVQRSLQEHKQGTSAFSKLMNLLMQLRKLVNHPYSIEDAAPDPYYLGEHLVLASSKFQLLDKLLKKILDDGEKVLIFSGFTGTLDLIEDLLRLREIKYGRLDGQTGRARRSLDIKLFNRDPSPFKVFLISTRAGGLGLNLATASNVVMFDCDWNPQATKQAIARAHRIGQAKTVKVYTLVAEESVESQMLSRIQKKEYLSAKVLGSTKHNMQNTAMSSLAASSSSASLGSTPLDASVASTPSDSQELLDPADDDHQADAVQSLGHDELLHILRGGSSALASTWAEDGKEDAAARFQKAPIEEILIRSRRLQNIQTARVERDVVGEVALTTDTAIELEAEEERLLQGREAVQTRLWQGRVHDKSKTNSEIRQDWERLEKRVRKERVVYIDGHPVSADSISSDVGWTAVPTITSDKAKLAQLAEPKRGRAKFEHQDFCLNCLDGGQVLQCRTCPRAMHSTPGCSGLSPAELKRTITWICPQHTCWTCRRVTGDAGGILFRCQTCIVAYCEDCLPADGWECLGDTLDVFEKLGFGANAQAYWIRCPECVTMFAKEPARRKVCKEELRQKAIC